MLNIVDNERRIIKTICKSYQVNEFRFLFRKQRELYICEILDMLNNDDLIIKDSDRVFLVHKCELLINDLFNVKYLNLKGEKILLNKFNRLTLLFNRKAVIPYWW